MTVAYTFRPLGPWTEPETDPRRSTSVFRATWEDTLKLLSRELELLDAQQVVIQVDADENNLRLDGMLRARTVVAHPGVRLAFGSRHGPLIYATDAYEQQWTGSLPGWQANVRAIALGLEALRAVDRWGVSRRGEQYRGWTALPPGSTPAEPVAMTREQAARELGRLAGWTVPLDATAPAEVVKLAYRHAAKLHHPDVGGDRTSWALLEEAKRVLDVVVAAWIGPS